MEVWAAVREKGPVWEMESVCVTQATLASCARAVLTATTGRRAPITAKEPVQVPNQRRSDCQLFFYTVDRLEIQEVILNNSSPFLPFSSFIACYHSCKKCSGPQDYKCLDCKPGWILHDNKCVGECISGSHWFMFTLPLSPVLSGSVCCFTLVLHASFRC